jgi:hypothetical protein
MGWTVVPNFTFSSKDMFKVRRRTKLIQLPLHRTRVTGHPYIFWTCPENCTLFRSGLF